MKDTKKITTLISSSLLENAQAVTEKNITDTLKEALELLIAKDAAKQLKEYRGKVDLQIDIEELRKDR